MKASSAWIYVACLLTVGISAVGVSIWSLNAAHYFYADDWGWLERVAFDGWSDVLRVLPTRIYNDRPAGEVFILLMYKIYGLESHPYNVLWLSLHVLNCMVFFTLIRKFLPTSRALIGAVLAATWYSTLLAVHWIGAIFDLAGATWCLLCLLFYLESSKPSRWSPFLLAGSVLMQVLAIRCKEFAIALVVVLASWEFLVIEGLSFRRHLVRLTPHILVTLIYGVIYLRLYYANAAFVGSGAYKISLSIPAIMANAAYYFSQAFYVPETWPSAVGYGLIVLVVILGLSSKQALAAVLSSAALMAAVLVMPNQRNALYLYAPHFFLACALCTVRLRSAAITLATAAFAAIVISWPFYSNQWMWSRSFYLGQGRYSLGLMDDYLQQMAGLPPPDSLTIGVKKTYFDPFSWGHGASLRIYYRDRLINASVIELKDIKDDVCKNVGGVCLIEQSGHLVLRK